MIGTNGLKWKPGFYYEGFITLNKTKQKSQACRKKSTWGLGVMDKIKSKANFQLIVALYQWQGTWLVSVGEGSIAKQ